MPCKSEPEYHATRERQASELAAAATDPQISAIHLDMAESYARKRPPQRRENQAAACKSAVAVAVTILLAACGKHQPTLTKEAVADAARACGARGVGFVPAEVTAEAPYIRVVDRTAIVDGKRIDVPRCISAKLSAYHYGRMVLDAAPAGNTN